MSSTSIAAGSSPRGDSLASWVPAGSDVALAADSTVGAGRQTFLLPSCSTLHFEKNKHSLKIVFLFLICNISMTFNNKFLVGTVMLTLFSFPRCWFG